VTFSPLIRKDSPGDFPFLPETPQVRGVHSLPSGASREEIFFGEPTPPPPPETPPPHRILFCSAHVSTHAPAAKCFNQEPFASFLSVPRNVLFTWLLMQIRFLFHKLPLLGRFPLALHFWPPPLGALFLSPAPPHNTRPREIFPKLFFFFPSFNSPETLSSRGFKFNVMPFHRPPPFPETPLPILFFSPSPAYPRQNRFIVLLFRTNRSPLFFFTSPFRTLSPPPFTFPPPPSCSLFRTAWP